MKLEKVFLSLAVTGMGLLTGCPSTPKQVSVRNEYMVCVKQPDLKLIVAALNRDQPGVEAAVQNGADVNITVEGLGPPLTIASMSDNYKATQLLIDKGADVNASDREGYTPLLYAVLGNNKEILQLLLSKGAEVNLTSSVTINGKQMTLTPMMLAKSKGSAEIIKLLTDAGAKAE